MNGTACQKEDRRSIRRYLKYQLILFTHTLMKPSYFVNDRLYLRAVEPEDLQVLYAIENDPQSWDISNFTVPYSKYVLKQYIENSQCDMFADKQLRLMIVRKSDRQVLGTVDITDFVPLHARGEVGIVIRK